MKKLLLVISLAVIVCIGTAFADHPDGFGIGIVGGGGLHFGDGGYSHAGLSLKIPDFPVYWGIYLDGNVKNYLALTITGDYYLLDNVLVPEIDLHWYLGVGVGAFLGLGDPFMTGAAARIPIGISWQPLPLLEIFLQVVPSIGFFVVPDFYNNSSWGGELGIRLWF